MLAVGDWKCTETNLLWQDCHCIATYPRAVGKVGITFHSHVREPYLREQERRQQTGHADGRSQVPRSVADGCLEEIMTTILIVVVLLMLFGGGGYYGYRRRWG